MALMPNIDQDLTHCVTTAIIWSLHNNATAVRMTVNH